MYGWPAPMAVSMYMQLLALVLGTGLALQLATTALVLHWGPPAGEPLMDPGWTKPSCLAAAAACCMLLLRRGHTVMKVSALAGFVVLGAAPLYNPLFLLVALGRAPHSPAPLWTLVGAAVIAGALMQSVLATLGVQGSEVHGSTRWGGAAALRIPTSGLLLGRLRGDLLRYDGHGHLLTVAATRSGKGVGAILPNLLNYDGSVVVTDPKGENYAVTARYRREILQQEIVALDPFGIMEKEHGSRYNPADLVDMNGDGYVETAMMLADMMVPGAESFWVLEARALIYAFLLHAKSLEGNLLGMRRLLTLTPEKLGEALDAMQESGVPQVEEGAARVRQKSDRERSSVFSTAQSRTHFLSSPRMHAVMSESTFDLRRLTSGGMTIYLILPREHLATFAPWLRLMVACCYYACTHNVAGRDSNAPRTLFLLDEFANLGYMSFIREAISLGGGYGITFWLILQDLAQLRREYRDGWESFVANCDVIQAFAIQDPFTSENVTKMLGDMSVWQRRVRRTSRSLTSPSGQGKTLSSASNSLVFPS